MLRRHEGEAAPRVPSARMSSVAVQLEAELRGLKLGALIKRAAVTEGIDEGAVELAVDDDDDPKGALIKVMLAHAEASMQELAEGFKQSRG